MSELPAGTLLDLLEPGWRRHLAAGEPAGTLDVEPEMLDAAARALGNLSRSEPPAMLSRRWPACIVVAVAQVTARYDKNGKVWPAWFLWSLRLCCLRFRPLFFQPTLVLPSRLKLGGKPFLQDPHQQVQMNHDLGSWHVPKGYPMH